LEWEWDAKKVDMKRVLWRWMQRKKLKNEGWVVDWAL